MRALLIYEELTSLMKNHSITLGLACILTTLVNAEFLPYDAKHLVAQRELAIKRIDEKFLSELEKLKTKYVKSGDLENALSINELIKKTQSSSSALGNSSDITGAWVFTFKGKERRYTFKDDYSMTGQFVDSGKGFRGQWKWFNGVIELYTVDHKKLPITVRMESATTAQIVGKNGKMAGVKQ